MMVHDLYQSNRGTRKDVDKDFLIKKVFVEGETADVDMKTPSEYGCEADDKGNGLEEALGIVHRNCPGVKLPYRLTGSASNLPYVMLFADLTVKNGVVKLDVSFGTNNNKNEPFKYHLDYKIKSEEYTEKTKDLHSLAPLPVRLVDASSPYKIDGKPIAELYKKQHIITGEGKLEFKMFHCVSDKLAHFIVKAINSDTGDGKIQFRVVLLPSKKQIEYMETKEKDDVEEEDAFGNPVGSWPTKATTTAKFFSFDDPAFTINGVRGPAFYKAFGIGASSFRNIGIQRMTKISGLNWVFLPDFPSKARGGFYSTLFDMYKYLQGGYGQGLLGQEELGAKAHIACLVRKQAKLEVLIDQNLTMEDLKDIFKGNEVENSPPMAFELLIRKKAHETLWGDYITAVMALLSRKRLQRNDVMAMLMKRFADDKKLLIDKNFSHGASRGSKTKGKGKGNTFDFERADFCFAILIGNGYKDRRTPYIMEGSENYAYHVGRAARAYIKFKIRVGEDSNSLRDILTYNRYDRDRLRFVVSRICNGIELSKADGVDVAKAEKEVGEELSQAGEIPDGDVSDYSYFFYKGAFEA